MLPGEFAVHYSQGQGSTPICTVCSTLAEAEAHARDQVTRHPTIRCRIYDHHGFVSAPLLEITGAHFKGELDLSPRLRRWTGFILLGVGIALCALDWSTGFRLSWPALIGSRLLIPGFVLLVTEALIQLHKHQKSLEARRRGSAP